MKSKEVPEPGVLMARVLLAMFEGDAVTYKRLTGRVLRRKKPHKHAGSGVRR